MKSADRTKGLRLSWEEVAGATGDFGTIFPIVLGVAIVSDVNLSLIFLFFGIFYIISGVYYRIPIPIEPMKAIGAVVIALGLGSGEIAAAGIIIGVFFLLIAIFRGMRFIRRYIPQSVIRGIQAGLALLLLRTSLNFITGDIFFAALSVLIILIFFLAARRWKIPEISALVVLGIGICAAIVHGGIPMPGLPPVPQLIIPDLSLFLPAAWDLALPQIPLTLTNAILATSLLAYDLFRRDVPPDRLAGFIGLMNLVAVPFGGFPMCHGAGGLAAQYRFGARTGAANIVAGVMFFLFALFFTTPALLQAIPVGIFGGLLIFVALELGRHAAKTDMWIVTIAIAVLTPFAGVTVAFIAGMLLAWVVKRTGRSEINTDS